MSKISELFPRGADGGAGGIEYWAGDIVATELTTLPDGRTLLPCDGSIILEGTYPDLDPYLDFQVISNIAPQATLSTNGTAHAGSLNMLTDGDKNTINYYGHYIAGETYVQLDLNKVYIINQIKVWHYYNDARSYNARLEVSEDGTNWTVIFDSDVSGTYAESAAGKTHDFVDIPVRYVREYLNGNPYNAHNHWVEIEVFTAPDITVLPDYTQHSNSYKVVAENGLSTTSPLRAGDQILTLRSDVGPSGQALLPCNGSMILKTEYPDLVGLLAEDLIIGNGRLACSLTNAGRQGDTGSDFYGGRRYDPASWDYMWKETQYLNVYSDFNRWAGSRSALYPDHVIPTFYRNWNLAVILNNGNWSGDDATMEAQFEDKDGVRIFGFRADRHSDFQTRMRYGLEGETNTTRSVARTSATNSHVYGHFSFDVDNQIAWTQIGTGAHSFTETGVRVQDIAQIRIVEVRTQSNWTSGGNTSHNSADAYIDIVATDGTAVVTDKLYLPTSANPDSSGFIALPYKVVAEN